MRDDRFCSELERALGIEPTARATLARRQTRILDAVQNANAERGLTLATLCDMVLGENAPDRSDDALIRAVRRLLDADAAPLAVPDSQYPIPNTQIVPGRGHSEKKRLQLTRTLGGVVVNIVGPRGGYKAGAFIHLSDLQQAVEALQSREVANW